MNGFALKTENLKKYYGRTRGLREGFSCDIRKGENTILLGSNGAGKSTLMNIAMNLISADSGTVLINGVDYRKPESRMSVRYLPESVILPEYCNTADMTEEYGRYREDIDFSDVAEMFDYFGCEDLLNQYYKGKSKGEKQLMLLSLMLSGKPEFLILDEPLEGLDPINIRKVRKRIKTLCESGTTVLQSTHRVHEVEMHRGNFLIIHDGRNIATGEFESLSIYRKLSRKIQQELNIPESKVSFSFDSFVIIEKQTLNSFSIDYSTTSAVTMEDFYFATVG